MEIQIFFYSLENKLVLFARMYFFVEFYFRIRFHSYLIEKIRVCVFLKLLVLNNFFHYKYVYFMSIEFSLNNRKRV